MAFKTYEPIREKKKSLDLQIQRKRNDTSPDLERLKNDRKMDIIASELEQSSQEDLDKKFQAVKKMGGIGSNLASVLQNQSDEAKKVFMQYLGIVKNKFSALSFLIQKYKKKVEILENKLEQSQNEYQSLAQSHQYLVKKLHTELTHQRAESRRAHSLSKAQLKLVLSEQKKNRDIKRKIEIENSNHRGKKRMSILYQSSFIEVPSSSAMPQQIQKFLGLLGFEVKKSKKEDMTSTLKGLSNSIKMKWSQIDESVKELVIKTVDYAMEELDKEKDNRLRAEEQSALIIDELHQNNKNLEERIKQLSKARTSHSLTQLIREQSNRNMLSSPIRGRSLLQSHSLQFNTSFQGRLQQKQHSFSFKEKSSQIQKNAYKFQGSGVSFQKVAEINTPSSEGESIKQAESRRSKKRSLHSRTFEFSDEE